MTTTPQTDADTAKAAPAQDAARTPESSLECEKKHAHSGKEGSEAAEKPNSRMGAIAAVTLGALVVLIELIGLIHPPRDDFPAGSWFWLIVGLLTFALGMTDLIARGRDLTPRK